MSRESIFIGNKADIFIEELFIRRNKLPDFDATPTVTLYDSANATVANAVDLPMTLDAGDRANYTGVIPRSVTLTLTENANYTAVIVDSTNGFQWEILLKAMTREGGR